MWNTLLGLKRFQFIYMIAKDASQLFTKGYRVHFTHMNPWFN